MSTTTPRLALIKPATADPVATLRTSIGANADGLDNAALITLGTSFPGSPKTGQMFLNTSSKVVFIYDGSAWIEFVTQGGATPIGSMVDYGGTTDPVDPSGAQRWVIGDGRSLSTTTYATLFTRLGNTWDAFDGQVAPGAGLFRIPKTGARVAAPAGLATGLTARTRGQAGGAETVGLPDHSHSGAAPDHLHSVGGLYTGNHAHSGSASGSTAGDSSVQSLAGGPLLLARGGHTHLITVDAVGNIGVGGNTGAADRGLGFTTSGPSAASIDKMQPWICLGVKIIRIA